MRGKIYAFSTREYIKSVYMTNTARRTKKSLRFIPWTSRTSIPKSSIWGTTRKPNSEGETEISERGSHPPGGTNKQTNKQKIPELRLIIWAANERWLLDRWSGKIWGREHRRRCPICILGSQLQQAITNFFSKWQKVKDFCSHRCISVSLKPPCFRLFFFSPPR